MPTFESKETLVIEHERDEKDKLISEMRQFSQNNENMQRDFELQQSMLEKLKQQLVDEKLKAQNLVADACAAEKRADSLSKVKEENRELSQQIQKLKNDLKTTVKQSGEEKLSQMQNELSSKESEISKLMEDLRRAQTEVNNDTKYIAEGLVY